MNGVDIAEIAISPLDEYKRHRRECERDMEKLVNYREWCRKRAADAAGELAEVDAAIGELETLLKLKQQPEGVR